MKTARAPGTYSTPQRRWQAVLTRDAAAEGRFFYGVMTTGIYCRPTCSARRPKQENVTFYDKPIEAERAGFRPCRKCHPHRDTAPGHAKAVHEACRRIEQAEEEPLLGELARAANLSPFHFQRVFRAITGLSPKQYAKAHRLGRLKDGLRASRSVTAAIYDAGFGTASRAYADAGERLGMKPAAYRKGGQQQKLRYGLGKTFLGWTLVAATARGVCMIAFGDTKRELIHELKVRFPQAELREGDAEFNRWMEAALESVERPALSVSLPLDIQGTAFQEGVWQALREIPPGTTASYKDIAEAIGKPDAVRAVGAACGRNDIAGVIPCHRVVGSDGKLHGYRWGLARKQALLDRERKKR